ncbi:hypothetical protein SSCG_01841 [Streptomyces clavuligerus]|nr:hypothetical protein SSCG_01841 [Streptomyces clavuligerus]
MLVVSLDTGMELPERIQGVDDHAEVTVVAACDLADTVSVSGWSRTAVDDALEAVEVLAAVLGRVEGLDEALAPVTGAVVRARRCLGLDTEPEPEPEPGPGAAEPAPAAGAVLPRQRVSRSRRRGLGPGYRGIPTG